MTQDLNFRQTLWERFDTTALEDLSPSDQQTVIAAIWQRMARLYGDEKWIDTRGPCLGTQGLDWLRRLAPINGLHLKAGMKYFKARPGSTPPNIDQFLWACYPPPDRFRLPEPEEAFMICAYSERFDFHAGHHEVLTQTALDCGNEFVGLEPEGEPLYRFATIYHRSVLKFAAGLMGGEEPAPEPLLDDLELETGIDTSPPASQDWREQSTPQEEMTRRRSKAPRGREANREAMRQILSGEGDPLI